MYVDKKFKYEYNIAAKHNRSLLLHPRYLIINKNI